MVNQEPMRDIVDKLLAIYCNDPLQSPVVLMHSFGQQDKDGRSPFTVRAGRERIGEGGVDEGFSTPRVRKRFRDGEGTGGLGDIEGV